jgi:hypothetical protein
MRRAGGFWLLPVLLTLAFTVVSPFVWACTVDAWTEGIHDAEADDVMQAVVSTHAVVEGGPLHALHHVPFVSRRVQPDSEPSATTIVVESPHTRAPPLA